MPTIASSRIRRTATRRPRRFGFAAPAPSSENAVIRTASGAGGCRRSDTPAGDGAPPAFVAAPASATPGALATGGGVSNGGGVTIGGGAGSGGGVIMSVPLLFADAAGLSGSDCSPPSRSIAQLEAGFAAGGGGDLTAAGTGAAGDGMSNRRSGGGVGASGPFGWAGVGVGSSVDTSTESAVAPPSSSRWGSSGATGVRSAAESSIPGSGMNEAVFAPSADIHSASALSRIRRLRAARRRRAARLGRARRALQEPELRQPAGEFVDPLDRQNRRRRSAEAQAVTSASG